MIQKNPNGSVPDHRILINFVATPLNHNLIMRDMNKSFEDLMLPSWDIQETKYDPFFVSLTKSIILEYFHVWGMATTQVNYNLVQPELVL